MKKLIAAMLCFALTGCLWNDTVMAAAEALSNSGYREVTLREDWQHYRCPGFPTGAVPFEAVDSNNKYVVGLVCIGDIEKKWRQPTRSNHYAIILSKEIEP